MAMSTPLVIYRAPHCYVSAALMQVQLGEQGLDKSWQKKYAPTAECKWCGGEARIGFVAFERPRKDAAGNFVPHTPGEAVCELHRNEGKGGFWLHDLCAVAVYFCRDCLEATAIYTQG